MLFRREIWTRLASLAALDAEELEELGDDEAQPASEDAGSGAPSCRYAVGDGRHLRRCAV